ARSYALVVLCGRVRVTEAGNVRPVAVAVATGVDRGAGVAEDVEAGSIRHGAARVELRRRPAIAASPSGEVCLPSGLALGLRLRRVVAVERRERDRRPVALDDRC